MTTTNTALTRCAHNMTRAYDAGDMDAHLATMRADGGVLSVAGVRATVRRNQLELARQLDPDARELIEYDTLAACDVLDSLFAACDGITRERQIQQQKDTFAAIELRLAIERRAEADPSKAG